MFCCYTSKNFPAHDSNFTEGEGDGIKSRLPFEIFSSIPEILAPSYNTFSSIKAWGFLSNSMPLKNILREGLCLDSLQSYPVSFSSEMILLNVNPRN